jgi:hypothetical protein
MKTPKKTVATAASLLSATLCAGAVDARDMAEDVVWRAGQVAVEVELNPAKTTTSNTGSSDDDTDPKISDASSKGTKGLSPDTYANGGLGSDIEFKS